MKEQLTEFFGSTWGIVLVGALIGIIAATLPALGNPPNMGVCVACFERDIAGALGLHRADVVQYLRPEVPGLVLGSLLAALSFKEFRPRGGSAPILRFVLGAFAMIGALVFLGCPWRALLRLAGGDFNAIVGLAGLVSGIGIGSWFLKNGFMLGRSTSAPAPAGWVMPVIMLGLLLMALLKPAFLFFSAKGPGSMHAPFMVSLGAGLLVGFLAQRSRFCTLGAFRDALLLKHFHLLFGVIALVIAALIIKASTGRFHAGVVLQPISHSHHLWNFAGMVLAGLCFTMAGGCPGRQLFLAGEGDTDAATFVLGMVTGAALAHNFSLASLTDRSINGVFTLGGPAFNGQIAVGMGLLFCLVIGFAMRERFE